MITCRVLERKKPSIKNLLTKLSFRNEGKVRTFSDFKN